MPIALLMLTLVVSAWPTQSDAHPADEICTLDPYVCQRLCELVPNSCQPWKQGAPSTSPESAAPAPTSAVPPASPVAPDRSDARRVTAPPQAPPSTVEAAVSVTPMKTAPEAALPALPPERSVLATSALYIKLGYLHILPKGLDHILFVLALFLASTRLKPLLIQVTTFTVAHSLTLALAALGLINAPSRVIEPLIALSIALVAIENVAFKDMTGWRPLIVFAFGLCHGLGFAGVLSDLGLPRDQFLSSLVSFNVGVELGQLTVILAAFVPTFLLRRQLAKEGVPHLYRRILVIPASLLIAATGVFWAVQRAFFGG